MKVQPVDVSRERLTNLINYLPADQVLEIERYTGLDPSTAVEKVLDESDEVYILETTCGLVTAMTGCINHGSLGNPFLLSTVHRKKHLRDWLKLTRLMVDHYLFKYERLVSDIDSEYDETVRWMKWLGFETGDPLPMGPNNHPFYRCVKRRDQWV